jgi:hypothetical protein
MRITSTWRLIEEAAEEKKGDVRVAWGVASGSERTRERERA